MTKDTFKELQVIDTYLDHAQHNHLMANCSECFKKKMARQAKLDGELFKTRPVIHNEFNYERDEAMRLLTLSEHSEYR